MTESSSGPQAHYNESDAQALIGKRVLVGLTHRNQADEIVGYEQFHGEIIRVSES